MGSLSCIAFDGGGEEVADSLHLGTNYLWLGVMLLSSALCRSNCKMPKEQLSYIEKEPTRIRQKYISHISLIYHDIVKPFSSSLSSSSSANVVLTFLFLKVTCGKYDV
jgi:hypothetical protein